MTADETERALDSFLIMGRGGEGLKGSGFWGDGKEEEEES